MGLWRGLWTPFGNTLRLFGTNNKQTNKPESRQPTTHKHAHTHTQTNKPITITNETTAQQRRARHNTTTTHHFGALLWLCGEQVVLSGVSERARIRPLLSTRPRPSQRSVTCVFQFYGSSQGQGDTRHRKRVEEHQSTGREQCTKQRGTSPNKAGGNMHPSKKEEGATK